MLLAVYLFNVAGYLVVFSLVIRHSDKLLVQRLDRDQYDDDDLFQIKMPLHLPYYNSQTNYERVNGEVMYKGVYYRYVKRKVADDTLYILCLMNEAKTKLQGEQTDYTKMTADIPTDKHSSSGKKASCLSEHNPQHADYSLVTSIRVSDQPVPVFVSPLHTVVLNSNFRPPESNA